MAIRPIAPCKKCKRGFIIDNLIWGDKGGHYFICVECYKEEDSE
jgi:hypothetical protein